MTGQSLLPLLSQPDAPGREEVLGIMGGAYHFELWNAHCFVRSGDWKYM